MYIRSVRTYGMADDEIHKGNSTELIISLGNSRRRKHAFGDSRNLPCFHAKAKVHSYGLYLLTTGALGSTDLMSYPEYTPLPPGVTGGTYIFGVWYYIN